ncbi:hypothetical protein C5O75_020960 [Burkholderia cepacia]|uniref:hypothetical protein n=1 Tax=Burkholderia cepacia TaxID=292 RepID=UPI000CF11520|nr:hypothetical protein [Burkholderia cepacia]KAB1589991.1 hypothetical protein C5O75_020960 [Burkholderia cepacia]
MNLSSTGFLIAATVSPLLICGCAPNSSGNNFAKALIGTTLQAVGIDAIGAGLLIGTMDNVNRSIYTDRVMNDAAKARAAAASDAIIPHKGRATEAQLKQMFPTTAIPVSTSIDDPILTKESAK